jgi:hypothetical protein
MEATAGRKAEQFAEEAGDPPPPTTLGISSGGEKRKRKVRERSTGTIREIQSYPCPHIFHFKNVAFSFTV